MTNEQDYINDYHGLELYAGFDTETRDNENGILFLVEFYLFKLIHGKLSHSDIVQFQIIVENITAYSPEGNKVKGLYDRGAGESLNHDKSKIRKVSHDNIMAISAFSRLFEDEGLTYHKDIAKHGFKWHMRYDNIYANAPRWLFKDNDGKYNTSFQWHPRDWFYFLTNGGYKFAWIFFPFFFIANILTCFTPKEETSGKLLMFVRLEAGSRWSKLMMLNKKICYFILRRRYGDKFIDPIAKTYFWQSDKHPIRVLTKDLELH